MLFRITTVITIYFSLSSFVLADFKSDSYNHLAYNYALIKQGISPSTVKQSFTENIALENVPEEFLPIYKEFIELTDQLQFNFSEIQKHESALIQNSKQQQQQELLSLAQKGAMALDIMGAGGTATTGVTFLSKFISGKSQSNALVSRESLQKYQFASKKLLTEFEFKLRLARKLSPNTETLTLKDAEQFVQIEREQPSDSYSSLLELDSRVRGFYPISYSLGLTELENKNFEKAYNNFQKSINQLSEVTYNSEIKASILESLIITSVQLKKSEQVITAFSDELARISPNNGFVHLVSAVKYASQRNKEKTQESFALASKYGKENAFVLITAFTVQCQIGAFDDCYQSLKSLKDLNPIRFDELRKNKAAQMLKENRANLYNSLFGLSFSWAMDWHMMNYDRLILTNTSGFTWTNIVAGNTYKESHSQQAFRPFEEYWYSYGNLEAGKAIAINLTKSTKNALEYVDVQLKTDQGTMSFRLQNLGNGQMKFIQQENDGA